LDTPVVFRSMPTLFPEFDSSWAHERGFWVGFGLFAGVEGG
jgi:hypothetical protein